MGRDEETVPITKPPEPVHFSGITAQGPPVYDCASFAVFAAGGRQLEASPNFANWQFERAEEATVNPGDIVRLIPTGASPDVINRTQEHWVVAIGEVAACVPHIEGVSKDDFGEGSLLAAQVLRGDGPIVLSTVQAAKTIYERSLGQPLDMYVATPPLYS